MILTRVTFTNISSNLIAGISIERNYCRKHYEKQYDTSWYISQYLVLPATFTIAIFKNFVLSSIFWPFRNKILKLSCFSNIYVYIRSNDVLMYPWKTYFLNIVSDDTKLLQMSSLRLFALKLENLLYSQYISIS